MTTLAEPEWDQQSRDVALALTNAPVCPVCKGDPALCQSEEYGDAWVAESPIRCHRTTALREAQAAFDKRHGDETNPHKDALVWPMRMLAHMFGGRT